MSQAVRNEPFSEINVTPFIDMLLVLLIMLILTIPIASHQVPVDLPQQGVPPIDPPEPHRLAFDAAGALSWDGRRIADAELPALLREAAKTDAPLAIDPDANTRYERFDQVLAQARRAGINKLGFMGRHRLED